MRSPRPFQHRLVGRLLLLGGIPTVLVLLTSLILGFARTREVLHQSVSNTVEDAARLAALDLSDENIQAVTAARTLAAASAEGLYGQRAESLSLLRSLLRSTPAFLGTYYVWEPREDDAEALSLGLQAGAQDEGGRFLPYWRRSAAEQGGLELVNNVDMEADGSLFYQEPRRVHAETGLPTTIITKPYTYEGVPLIEHTHPIVIDGRFMGIAGVDRSLERVLGDLVALRDELGARSDLFLVTRGLYIAATEDDRAAETGLSRLTEAPVAGSRYAELLRTLDDRDRSSFVTIATDPVLEEPCFYGVARVQPGDWMLVVRQPVAAAEAVANHLVTSNAVGTFAAFAAAGLILFLLARPLVLRVERSADAVDRIGDGDLALRIDADDARDETGDLLRGVSGMSNRLRGMAGDVDSARRDIASVTDEIVASSESESSNASDFGASATEIAAAVREIAATARELDTDVRRVDGRAAETRETMRGGRRRLEEMSEGMQSIQEATRSIAARLGEISRSATSIGGVVDTIGRIAEQTNLLSVNAAIEAEKAGEYGTGFLVVAREIRRLADQTAGATGEITDTVEGMQSAVSSGVMEMDRYTDRVRRAVDEAGEVSRGLGVALDAAGENAEAIGRVAEGVAAQAAGAGQIDSAMVGLSRGAEQATQTAERLRAAARRLERATNSLNDALDGWRIDGLGGHD